MVYFIFVCLMLCLMDFNTCNPEFTGILIFFLFFCCFFQNLLSHYHTKEEITVNSFFTKKNARSL